MSGRADPSAGVCTCAGASSDTQALLARRVRRELPYLLSDESAAEPAGFALYTLADPRDVRRVRYVGQTASPRRRYLQHVRTARLWLVAETPWWVRVPRMRALYVWIRELYLDEARLPFMLVGEWLATAAEVRARERQLIGELAACGLPLLNVEAGRLGAPPEPSAPAGGARELSAGASRRARRRTA